MEKRSRGRPKQFDEAKVLAAAGRVFWQKGYSATSLDDLAVAMEMNRPSIYRAFGDKQTIYLKTLSIFSTQMELAMEATLFAEHDIRKGLGQFYRAALKVYTEGEQPLGCMVMSTAVPAAATHPEIQNDLSQVIKNIDNKLKRRFQQAMTAKALPEGFDVATRVPIAQGVLHSLSIRARAGESKAKLKKMIDDSVNLVLS